MPNVIVQALWLDEDDTAVVRLREIAGRPADGRLSSAVFLGQGSIPVRLKPFEMQMVRLAPSNLPGRGVPSTMDASKDGTWIRYP
jgi:hypothetical protein